MDRQRLESAINELQKVLDRIDELSEIYPTEYSETLFKIKNGLLDVYSYVLSI